MNKPTKTPKPSQTPVTASMRIRAAIVAFFFVFVGFGAVIFNLVDYQIINTEFYRSKTDAQLLADEKIVPHRGTIYDANMKILARSITVWSVEASPRDMAKANTNVNMVATKLAEILELPVDEIMEKLMKSETNYQSIKRKIEKPVANEIETWIAEYNASEAAKTAPIAGLYLVEDSKRYYPYGNFASTVIGFTNIDGAGVTGLELKYNETLTGTAGRVVRAKNAWGYDMDGNYEAKHDAEDGNSLVLTINENIQHSLEKYLGNAVAEHKVAARGTGIVMNVKTGAILGMATLPDYDLNAPYTLYDTALAEQINAITDEKERTAARQAAQQKMWRNKAVQDVYEPGSVFKVVTASAALDSGVADLHTSFTCTGKIQVANHSMRCAKAEGHGTLDFFGGIDNSCNPYFIQLAQRMGSETFVNYLQAFGFYEKTGIDMQNEAQSVMIAPDKMKITELSSSAFGQSSTVTPIAMITAFATAVNGGKLLEPYVVQQVLDSNGNIIENHEPVVKRQAISAETSATICQLLEKSVDGGHNKLAYVKGYRVGGKSGTSQKQSVVIGNEDDHLRIASFCGFAPADDPEVAVLIILDEPNDQFNSYGGRLCGPVVGSVIADIMPYIGVNPQYTAEDLETMSATVPAVTEISLSDALTKLNAQGFNYRVEGEGTNVTYQYPQAGTALARQSTIVLYTEEGSEGKVVTVPDVMNISIETATARLKAAGLNLQIDGIATSGTGIQAVKQSVEPGTEVPMGTVVQVTFHDITLTD